MAIFSSEFMHAVSLRNLRLANLPILRSFLRFMYKSPENQSIVMGQNFANPIGVAAGMDKRGECISCWENLGFGWAEIGGITLHPQDGNPKPRMFRSAKHNALINRMGFNNLGSDEMQIRLHKLQEKKRWANVPIAINLGKSKITPNNEAERDYAGTMEKMWQYADLFVINVSSPNTPNLRELQAGSELDRILVACNDVNRRQSELFGRPAKPLLVKVSPDLDDDQLRVIADTAMAAKCAGIVATNTTLERPANDAVMAQEGGLSGRPLRARSTEVIRLLYSHSKGRLPIVGVGGISCAQSAWEKIAAGACLLQLYSALVFEGPGVVKAINKGLKQRLISNGYATLSDAVGHEHRLGTGED